MADYAEWVTLHRYFAASVSHNQSVHAAQWQGGDLMNPETVCGYPVIDTSFALFDLDHPDSCHDCAEILRTKKKDGVIQ